MANTNGSTTGLKFYPLCILRSRQAFVPREAKPVQCVQSGLRHLNSFEIMALTLTLSASDIFVN